MRPRRPESLTREVTMPHAYTEAQLVEQPAIALFAGPAWRVMLPLQET